MVRIVYHTIVLKYTTMLILQSLSYHLNKTKSKIGLQPSCRQLGYKRNWTLKIKYGWAANHSVANTIIIMLFYYFSHPINKVKTWRKKTILSGRQTTWLQTQMYQFDHDRAMLKAVYPVICYDRAMLKTVYHTIALQYTIMLLYFGVYLTNKLTSRK